MEGYPALAQPVPPDAPNCTGQTQLFYSQAIRVRFASGNQGISESRSSGKLQNVSNASTCPLCIAGARLAEICTTFDRA